MAVKARTEYERKVLVDMANRVHLDSKLEFLSTHNGLRPGNMHVFLGNAGAGKSTAMRGIVFDYLAHNAKCDNMLLWLSEETTADFETEFFRGIPASPITVGPLNLFSEIESDCTSKYQGQGKTWLQIFEQEVIDSSPKLVIFDNITTSGLYAGNFSKQGEAAIKLKELASKYDFALVVLAHTGGKVSDGIDRLIDMDDIRGSKDIVNLSNFFYILQRFKLGPSEFFPTIRITKHRGQALNNGDIFYLDYSATLRIYKCRKSLPFAEFNDAFNSRQRLVNKRGN